MPCIALVILLKSLYCVAFHCSFFLWFVLCIISYVVCPNIKYSKESWRISLAHIVCHLCEYICTVNYSSKTLKWQGMCCKFSYMLPNCPSERVQESTLMPNSMRRPTLTPLDILKLKIYANLIGEKQCLVLICLSLLVREGKHIFCLCCFVCVCVLMNYLFILSIFLLWNSCLA